MSLLTTAKNIWRRFMPLYQSLFFVPVVVAAVILAATFFGIRAANSNLKQDIYTSAGNQVNSFQKLLNGQLTSYQQILLGGVGLFQGSDDVTRQDFTNYLRAFNLKRNYPAVQGIAFAKVFSADELWDVQQYLQEQGIDNFEIQPSDPPRQEYAAVIYAQTVASTTINPRLGFDGYSDPTRQEAMFKARDSGLPAISKPVRLNTPNKNIPATGFNMYVPYYAGPMPVNTTERQAAIKGYVYAAFLGQVFFGNVAAQSDIKNMAISVGAKVGDKDIQLFKSADYDRKSKRPNAIKQSRTFQAYGQEWNIHYIFMPGQLVSKIQLNRPAGILFFGIFSAILIAIILWLLLEGRTRALSIQKEKDIELAKDELLSLASHQLRTPATGVKQYLGMVLQGFAGDVPRQQQLLLEKAYASNDRQLNSINEILHVAKINSGHITLARQQTDINNLLNDIVQEQSPDIKSAGHKLNVHMPKRHIKLWVDTHMLRMATENVLSNAIKYTLPKGTINLSLRQRSNNIEIVVKDNGIGIKPEDFPKLFKQFTRLPNQLSHVGGTGVGLYLAKYLVELHGGSITLESKPNKGSTFTICLPKDSNTV